MQYHRARIFYDPLTSMKHQEWRVDIFPVGFHDSFCARPEVRNAAVQTGETLIKN